METVSMFHLDLTLEETGMLFCLMRLGMDTFAADGIDMKTLQRLDRLPAEAFKTLALKMEVLVDRLTELKMEVLVDRLTELGGDPL